jgi:CDP-paratose 2-epimerase
MKRTPKIGLVECFRPGEFNRVESVLAQARALGVTELRTAICWADWYTSEGDGWYAWLLPRLAQDVNILPCFLYTPPSLGIAPKFSSPPAHPKAYADFLDVMITRFGRLFDWIELWNRPNSLTEWDSRMDPNWDTFSEMIGGAAYWIRKRGKKGVLPGLWPADLEWFNLMHQRGVLQYIDAVGLHGFPSASEFSWDGWPQQIGRVRERLTQLGVHPELWITQTGFSTWRGVERAQAEAFIDAINSPVERVYWQRMYDGDPGFSASDSSHADEREYHYGLKRAGDTPKLLFQLWSAGGLAAVKDASRTRQRAIKGTPERHVLITGGCGFIGTNLAHRLLSMGQSVLVYDDLSRAGTEANLSWLRETHGDKLRVKIADVRDSADLRAAVRGAGQVFHFAAQVAVTTSLVNPRHDFEVNIGGTLNLLEAIRAVDNPPNLVFTSTNKVYGALADLLLERSATRYQPLESSLRSGVSEERPLDFHSPYGCSKGAADQYVLDYARTFHIPALVFRMSCIYGPHQMGNEDQGWVAHFLIAALEKRPLMIFGDGMQVRDLLFVEDLVDAFLLAQTNSQTLAGEAFNIGGGLGNTTSLLEILDVMGSMAGEKPAVEFHDWRPGDQRYYVSDIRKFKAATGWAPKVSIREGVERLYLWLLQSRGLPIPAPAEMDRNLHAVLTH